MSCDRENKHFNQSYSYQHSTEEWKQGKNNNNNNFETEDDEFQNKYI